MNNIKSLCSSCLNNCSGCTKVELAMKGSLSYIYLNNGDKVTYSCRQFKGVRSPVNVSAASIDMLKLRMSARNAFNNCI